MDREKVESAFELAWKDVDMNAKNGVVREEVVRDILESLFREVMSCFVSPKNDQFQ